MIEKILKFWFEEIEQSKWWVKDEEFDQLIITKYSEIHQKAIKGELLGWRSSAKGRLAEIIILDQFSRNMFRNSPSSFAFDSLALALAQEAIFVGDDKKLSAIQRNFLYMPFMHSESLIIHEKAVELFKANGSSSSLAFELKHKAIIEKYCRYPHRNYILGRKSTDEELEFLKEIGSSF